MSQENALAQILIKKRAVLESRLKLHNIERGFEDYANEICYSVSQSPSLSKCSPSSIVDAALHIAKVGLHIGGNVAHLVPFGDKCTFQIGYQGYSMLLGRVIPIVKQYYDVIYADDEFTFSQDEEASAEGLKCVGTFKRKRGQSKDIKGAFAYTILSDGNSFILYMDKVEVDRYKPKATSGNFWGKWDDIMYAKQVLKIQHRQLLKWYAPCASQEVADLVADDENINLKATVKDVSSTVVDASEAFDISPSELITPVEVSEEASTVIQENETLI